MKLISHLQTLSFTNVNRYCVNCSRNSLTKLACSCMLYINTKDNMHENNFKMHATNISCRLYSVRTQVLIFYWNWTIQLANDVLISCLIILLQEEKKYRICAKNFLSILYLLLDDKYAKLLCFFLVHLIVFRNFVSEITALKFLKNVAEWKLFFYAQVAFNYSIIGQAVITAFSRQ